MKEEQEDLGLCNRQSRVRCTSLGRSVFKKQLLAREEANPAFLSEGIWMMSPPIQAQEHS